MLLALALNYILISTSIMQVHTTIMSYLSCYNTAQLISLLPSFPWYCLFTTQQVA